MGWRDSSVDKVLALQHRGPKFGPQDPQRSLASMGQSLELRWQGWRSLK